MKELRDLKDLTIHDIQHIGDEYTPGRRRSLLLLERMRCVIWEPRSSEEGKTSSEPDKPASEPGLPPESRTCSLNRALLGYRILVYLVIYDWG